MKKHRWMAWLLTIAMLMGSVVFPAGAEEEHLPPPEIMEKREGEYFPYLIWGSYEQDNNLENGPEPIEWFVLKQEDERALVLSRHALELKTYHHVVAYDTAVSWETWDIRAWLNGEFLQTAFTEAEQKRIPMVTVQTPQRLVWDDPPITPDTEDQIFFLSFHEAERYMKGGRTRKCQPTAYAIANYEAVNGKEWDPPYLRKSDAENCSWWVRTQGEFPGSASWVMNRGSVGHSIGLMDLMFPDKEFIQGVRPAMWIDLKVTADVSEE